LTVPANLNDGRNTGWKEEGMGEPAKRTERVLDPDFSEGLE
jgi:hypothetical protein